MLKFKASMKPGLKKNDGKSEMEKRKKYDAVAKTGLIINAEDVKISVKKRLSFDIVSTLKPLSIPVEAIKSKKKPGKRIEGSNKNDMSPTVEVKTSTAKSMMVDVSTTKSRGTQAEDVESKSKTGGKVDEEPEEFAHVNGRRKKMDKEETSR